MEESAKMLDAAEPTTEEETETTVAEPEKENTAENQEKLEFTEETEESESNDENSKDEEEKAEQSKEENSKYAAARRKAEAEYQKKVEAEAKKKVDEAYRQGQLSAFKGRKNPYTGTVIEDETDIQVYENMYELEKAGKDPVADYASYVAEKQRQEKKEQAERQKLQEEAEKDIADFAEKYPDVNLGELLEDETFKDYMEGKRKPLIAIYENYKKLENSFRNKAVDVAKQTIANSQSTPGSLGSGSDVTVDYSNMSSAEFAKYVQRAKDGELR